MKYIDAEKLKAEIERKRDNALERQKNLEKIGQETVLNEMIAAELNRLISFIDSLQQDDTQIDKILCSQIWWEKQGWIMIPPDVTIEGIDSLLKQVRKKLQQEQPEVNLEKEFKEYVDDDPVFSKLVNYYAGMSVARHFYELGLNVRKNE